MDKPHGLDTPESWGAASRGYAEKVAPLLMSAFVDEFVDRLDVGSDHDVLEVAAGTGVLTQVLASRAGSVLATDFAPEMIEVLRERMEGAGAANVRFAVMNGQALEVEDASFDRAACCFGLMLFPDRAKGFSELRRAVRPGGRAMVSGWAGPDKFEAFGLFTGALKAAFPDLPEPPVPPPVFSLGDLDQFRSEMHSAGFSDVDAQYVTRELSIDDFETLWGMLTVGAPPVQKLFDLVGSDGKGRVREALAEMVAQKFGSGPIKLTNSATVACGSVVA